jgi:hypothetical protein
MMPMKTEQSADIYDGAAWTEADLADTRGGHQTW